MAIGPSGRCQPSGPLGRKIGAVQGVVHSVVNVGSLDSAWATAAWRLPSSLRVVPHVAAEIAPFLTFHGQREQDAMP